MDTSTHANPAAAPRDAAALAPDTLTDDALDAILRQIVGGYFVLTDGQGSVSKWSEPAELLFGRPSPDVLGHPFFATLIQAPLPPAAEAWRGFLERGEPPEAPGRVEVGGLHADGNAFPMDTLFVPVKLDEGFDFSLFLEDLGFELPLNLMLQRMRSQHPVVVRALQQALEAEPQPWEGWRTAGTLVVFRPLAPTPWVEQALAAREAARAEADAEVEERLSTVDPGIQGSVTELDDAAAVVARLLSAMERIDELERIALGLPGQLDEARQQAERRAEAAEREVHALRTELTEARERAEHDRAREAEAARARLDELRAALEASTAESTARIDAVAAAAADASDIAARLDGLETAAAEAGELRTRLETLAAGDVEALRSDLAAVRDGVAQLEARSGEVADLRRSLEERDAAPTVPSDEIEALRARLAELSEADEASTRRADELAARVESMTGRLDEVAAVNGRVDEIVGRVDEAVEARLALERRIDEVDQGAGTVLEEVRTVRERVDEIAAAADEARGAGEAQAAALREEVEAVRRIAEAAQAGLDALRTDVDTAREQAHSLREDAASARTAAESGERRVEAMQAELTFAMKSLEDLKAGLTSAGQAAVMARREAEQAKRAAQSAEGTSGIQEVFAQLIAAARTGGGRPVPRRTEAAPKPAPPKREPRHGFDDVSHPCAILTLDGRFRELNPAFARLVGYQEHEFAKATWPSPHDRALYQQQQEQLRQLAKGDIETVSVQSTYMHGQGLMVPVAGTLRAVPGEDGLPLHLLLEAEERHTG